MSPRHLSCNPWITLLASVLLMVSAGTSYAFSAYAPSLKQRLHLQQVQITTVITFSNLGQSLALLPSLCNDFLGPRMACLVAACALSLGYSGALLATMGTVVPEQLTFPLLLLCFFMVGQGNAAAITAALVSNMKNWPPQHRGKISGLLVAVLGFAGAFFSLVFQHVFQRQLLPFLAFMAAFGLAAPLIGVVFVTYRHSAPPSHSPVAAAAVVEAVQDIADHDVGAVDKSGLLSQSDIADGGECAGDDETQLLLNGKGSLLLSKEANPHSIATYEEGETVVQRNRVMDEMVLVHSDKTPLQVILSLDCWLYMFTYFAAFGSGLLVINNLGSIMISYGAEDGDQNSLVVMLSLSGMIGRLLIGLLSDRFRQWVSRVGWIGICTLAIGFSQVALAFVTLGIDMYIAVCCTGMCYGGLLSLAPPFVSDRYGQKYLGINMNIKTIYGIAASFGISSWLASFFYQLNIPDKRSNLCHGRSCWQPTFFICAGLCCLGFMTSMLLMYRTRLMYTKRSEYYLDYEDYLMEERIHKMQEKIKAQSKV